MTVYVPLLFFGSEVGPVILPVIGESRDVGLDEGDEEGIGEGECVGEVEGEGEMESEFTYISSALKVVGELRKSGINTVFFKTM